MKATDLFRLPIDVSLIGVQITAMIINQLTGPNDNGEMCGCVYYSGEGGWTLNGLIILSLAIIVLDRYLQPHYGFNLTINGDESVLTIRHCTVIAVLSSVFIH